MAAERNFHKPEIRDSGPEELPHPRGQGPASKDWLLRGRRRAERSYSTIKVRRGSCEKIPLIQGKEQQLRFTGAVVKRYTTSKVRESQVRR